MFKDKLRKLREENGLSQYELADKIYVSRSAIAKWENGFGMPGKESLEILCEFFNVTKEYLLEEDEPIKIIENVNRLSRKKIFLLSLLLIPLILYLLVSTGFFICNKIHQRNFPQHGSFYTTKYLKKFGLKDLEMIESNNYGTKGTASPYFFAEIDSYEVFDNYVNYVYNKLFYSPDYAYVGYSVKILPDSQNYIYNKNIFLMQSFNLSNHIVSCDKNDGKPTEYIFYFMTKNDYSRDSKDSTKINYLKLTYHVTQNLNNTGNYEKYYECSMDLRKCSTADGFSQHYLINEYYDIQKIPVTKNNIDLYIDVKFNWLSISFSSKYDNLIYNDKIASTPYDIFIKVNYTLTPKGEYEKLGVKNIVRYYNLQNFDHFQLSDIDVGMDNPNSYVELEKYNIEIEYEVLENSYFYSLI